MSKAPNSNITRSAQDPKFRLAAAAALRATATRLSMAMALSVTASACGNGDGADEFRQGVPYHEDIAMVVPGESTQQSALTAASVTETRHALLGEQAETYAMTRKITATVNGATAAVLTLLKTITDFPPTSVGADVAVWGPYTDSPLAPKTWRLTVNRVGDGMFHYDLAAKPRATDDTMYLTVLSGHHNVANPGTHRRSNLPAYGNGDFVLDWDNAQKLPEHDDNVGKAAFMYSRPSPTADVTINATFTQVLDRETQMLIDARYAYVETPGAGGNFQFTLTKDAVTTTPALETLSVRSRWQENGAGRSDVKVAGGDVGATAATANECWGPADQGFLSVYQTNSYGDPAKMWGADGDCAFSMPEYALF